MQTRPIPFALVLASIGVVSALYCENITQKYSPPERHVTQHDNTKNITLYYDNELGRAAAELLHVVLLHALGYQDVQLLQSDDRIPTKEPCMINGTFEEVTITISVPTQLRFHLHLAKPFWNKSMCFNIVDWDSYSDPVTASECGFEKSTRDQIYTITSQSHSKYGRKSEFERLCPEVSSTPFKFVQLNRSELFEILRSGNRSFLFIDYDMWAGDLDVSVAELPPFLEELSCLREQDLEIIATATTSVSDHCLMEEYAPQLYNISSEYAPSITVLRTILERTSNHKDEIETTCKWITENNAIVDTLIDKYKPVKKNYTVISIICDTFPDMDGLETYDRLLTYLGNSRLKNNNSNFHIIIQSLEVDCIDKNDVIEDINQLMLYDVTPSLIGIVIADVLNVENITKIMNKYNVPVLLYDTTNVDVTTIESIAAEEFSSDNSLTTPLWITGGRSLHLTLAFQHFIHIMGWIRIALISEESVSAIDFRDQLIGKDYLIDTLLYREYKVKQNATELEVKEVLQKIKEENGRIIVVNTDSTNAVKILSAAVKLEMNTVENYAWLLREWRPSRRNKLNITHFVLSFWCKDSKDVLSYEGQIDHRQNLDELSPYLFWPPLAGALGNALLTLVIGFDNVLLKYPQARDDTQSRQVIRQFERSLAEVPIKGITQTLNYKKHMLEASAVFVEQWHEGKRTLLMQMRVNSTSRTVKVDTRRRPYEGISPPDDFASRCTLETGDPYEPTCYHISGVIVGMTWLLILLIAVDNCVHRWRRKNTVYKAVSLTPEQK